MHKMPCTRCVRDRHANCVLRETKRGTYNRSGLRQEMGRDYPRVRSAAGVVGGVPPRSAYRMQAEDNGAIPLHSPDAAATASASTSAPNLTTRSAVGTVHVQPRNGDKPLPAPELPPASESPPVQPSPGNPADGSSYQDISWSVMFDYFLNNRENGRDCIDKCSITYLGESFPLAIVLGSLKDGSRPKLHHPGPPFPGTQTDVSFHSRPAHVLPEDLEYLRAKGVFKLPEKAHLDSLISVFLDRVYPLYPIVNCQEFIQQYKNDELPLILIYAVSFIAVTFASQPIISPMGFDSRQEARSYFYKKAKALFDMGYETNKITALQATLLLSFWGGGPNTYWNFYSWLSTAVTIAEAIGIHRSTIGITNMQPQDKSLMRRLWWTLVVRDSICGALVGRPFRIDLDQADTDMLTIEDFAHDAMVTDFLENSYAQRYAQYQIETAKLSLIMRDIIISRFYPGREPVRSEDLHAKLAQWKAGLVPTLAWQDEVPDYSNPFSMSLSVQYSHHLILIYLGHVRGENTCHRDEQEIEEIVDCAAHHIPTVVCTLATKSALLTVPHELFHGIFLAQAALYERIRSPNKLVGRLGRSALNNCQMVLQAISEFWDPGPFILQLFDNLSSHCSERQSLTTDSRQDSCVLGTAETPGLNSAINFENEAGAFNALLGDDRWQGNPVLSSLFDLPPELFLSE